MRAFPKIIMAAAVLLVLSWPLLAGDLPANGAYVLVNNASLNEEGGNGVLKYLEGLTIGDQITVVGGKANFKESGNVREYTRVRAVSGKEGWLRSQYFSTKATLAVVKTEKAIIYSEPRDVKVTSRYISPMILVAVLDELPSSGWAKVQAWDYAQKTLLRDNTFVNRSDLSFVNDDIQSIILMTVAKDTANETIKKKLLGLALSKYPSSIFSDQIAALANPQPSADSAKFTLLSPTKLQFASGTIVNASSAMPAETTTNYRYDVSQLFDGNPKTAWVEGSTGSGEGEWIELIFPSERAIDAIEIMGGFFDARWYKVNARVRNINVTGFSANNDLLFDQSFTLDDAMRAQELPLEKKSYKRLVLTIQSVYGEENKDLPISELSLKLAGNKVQP